MKAVDEDPLDDLFDVEKKGFLTRVSSLRPRNGSVASFENHTYEAGHPVDWNEACGVFRDPSARFIRASDDWYMAVGHAWEDGRGSSRCVRSWQQRHCYTHYGASSGR